MRSEATALAVVLLFSAAARGQEQPAPRFPTLEELQEWSAPSGFKSPEAGKLDIRAGALRESALAVGAQGAFAVRSREFNQRLLAHEQRLSDIFRFDQLLMANGQVLPPVVIEARNTAVIEAGSTLSQVEQMYKIEEPARLISAPPVWQTYLLAAQPTPPNQPPPALLPQNGHEQDTWRQTVAEGWQLGLLQAERAMQLRIARLHRAFVGRVRYHLLRLRGMMTEPRVTRTRRGIQGGGNDLRIGEAIVRLVETPRFVQDPRRWKALPQLPSAFAPYEEAITNGKAVNGGQ